MGRFQLADGGTLFLDEVGEIPLELQSKLLRVVQEGQFERIGEESSRQVDVRLIAATNRDLRREVEAKRFRPDLYFRLSVFPIEVPPLRDRLEDIPLLASHFLRLVCQQLNRPPRTLTQRHVQLLQSHAWPGNVRELQNIIERAVITAQGGALRFDLGPGTSQPKPQVEIQGSSPKNVLTEQQKKRQEQDNIVAALSRTGGKVYGPGGAAELLGIKPTTLASRLKKMGLRKNSPRTSNERGARNDENSPSPQTMEE